VDPDRLDAARAARGDSEAFERLYRKHMTRIHSLTYRMIGLQDREEVADLTQEIFVRAWQKLATFRGEAAFGSWLYRLAINLILARRAAFGIRRSRQQGDGEALERLSSRPAAVDFRLDFEAAIGQVPDGAREIFVLHDVEGHKHDEIAGLLGISTGTSKAQLHRARMLLRRYLTAGEGATP